MSTVWLGPVSPKDLSPGDIINMFPDNDAPFYLLVDIHRDRDNLWHVGLLWKNTFSASFFFPDTLELFVLQTSNGGI